MLKNGLIGRIFLMGISCLILTFLIWKWTENRINHFLSQINSGLERIAQVKSSSHDVSRNHTGQLLWQAIDSGEIIYLGNSVQTEKNSSTEIIFDDGEQIVIGPESLVRFVREDNKISLQLVNGKIEIITADEEVKKNMRIPATKSKRLFIATPKGRLELNDSNIKIQSKRENPSENFKVEVVSGTPELITETEKEILKINTEPTEKIDVLKSEPPPSTAQETPAPQPALQTTPPPAETAPVEANTKPTLPEPEPAVSPAPERKPAQIPLKAPKVRSIKVEADE